MLFSHYEKPGSSAEVADPTHGLKGKTRAYNTCCARKQDEFSQSTGIHSSNVRDLPLVEIIRNQKNVDGGWFIHSKSEKSWVHNDTLKEKTLSQFL